MFHLHKNVKMMKIVRAQRTHATMIFVTVAPKKDALADPILVSLDNANAVYLMNVHLQKRVLLEHVKVKSLLPNHDII